MRQLQNYINGSYVNPAAGKYSQIINPSNGQAYVEAPLSTDADIDAASRPRARPSDWRRTTPGERSLLLFRVADALEARKDEFVEAECRNTGKPSPSSATRSSRNRRVPAVLRRCCARPPRPGGRIVPRRLRVDRTARAGRCCGLVSPWNYPLAMAVWKFGPAIAAGNTAVLKPSDTTPVTSLLAAQIIGEILPPGVLNVIRHRETGRLWSRTPYRD